MTIQLNKSNLNKINTHVASISKYHSVKHMKNIKNLADFPWQQGSHSSHVSHELFTYMSAWLTEAPDGLGGGETACEVK